MTTVKLERKLKDLGITRKRNAAGTHIIYSNGEKDFILPHRSGNDVNKMLIKNLERTFGIKGVLISKNTKAKNNKASLNGYKVNYHLTAKCNFKCGHCFAKYTLNELDIKGKKDVIKSLAKAGVKEINFAGGEPMYVKGIKELFKLTKKLGMKVSVITNGSYLINRGLFKYIDTLGVSIDSFDNETNLLIGRHSDGEFIDYEELIKQAREQGVKVKVNTVVTKLNINEDFKSMFDKIRPDRLKYIMVKNGGDVQISEQDFKIFTKINSINTDLVLETSEALINSYIIIDPLGRFAINSELTGYEYTNDIINYNIEKEFAKVPFNKEAYGARYE